MNDHFEFLPKVTSPKLLLEHLGIDEPSEINVEAIAQACGATVIYEPLSGCDARIVGAGDRAIITVNQNATRARQRFSVAHELGHWMHDRGKIAFACAEGQFQQEWGRPNPERRANWFASNLLLPRLMFKHRARHCPITLATVEALAREFQTSMTATAIRLVELGSYPAVVVCSHQGRLKWQHQNHGIPVRLSLRPTLNKDSLAFALRQSPNRSTGKNAMVAGNVPTSAWIQHSMGLGTSLYESSMLIGQYTTLSLLWWQDEVTDCFDTQSTPKQLH